MVGTLKAGLTSRIRCYLWSLHWCRVFEGLHHLQVKIFIILLNSRQYNLWEKCWPESASSVMHSTEAMPKVILWKLLELVDNSHLKALKYRNIDTIELKVIYPFLEIVEGSWQGRITRALGQSTIIFTTLPHPNRCVRATVTDKTLWTWPIQKNASTTMA